MNKVVHLQPKKSAVGEAKRPSLLARIGRRADSVNEALYRFGDAVARFMWEGLTGSFPEKDKRDRRK